MAKTVKKLKNKLPPAMKRKWVAALRSGKYKQGTEELVGTPYGSDRKEYCCLGVLAAIGGGKQERSGRELLSRSCGLPKRLQIHLAAANDGEQPEKSKLPEISPEGEQASFKTIAAWIEKYL